MQTTESISTLNELVLINNDRVAGYNKAWEELRSRSDDGAADSDLVQLFSNYAEDSRSFSAELAAQVRKESGEVEEGTMMSGKLFRAWMDIKALFTGKDRHAILASCETGEDAAQRSYTAALGEEDLSADARAIINRQQVNLKQAHEKIKALRDQSK